MIIALLLLILGIILFLIGAGFGLGFLSYMIRGVSMSWSTLFLYVILAAVGLAVGLWLIFSNVHVI
jgi:hypothetical protein